MINDFPDWAPRSLCKMYQEWHENNAVFKYGGMDVLDMASDNIWLIKKLISHQEMEPAWKALYKRFDNRPNQAEILLGVILDALNGPVSKWEELTNTEKADWVSRVKAKTYELSKLIEQSPFEAENCLPEDYWKPSFKHLFDPYYTFYAQNLERLHQEKIDLGNPPIDKVIDGKLSELLGTEVKLNPLSDTLGKFSAHLDHKLKLPNILTRPNTPKAKRLYFIRYLGNYTSLAFNTPLYDVIARIASIALDEDIDKDIVRSSLKDQQLWY